MTAFSLSASAAVRVAMIDFSTDSNSYRSAQAAANFARLLQIRLANEPEVEWVERQQLEMARQEMQFSEMEMLSGTSPLQWGRFARADWIIKGQFSSDDRNRQILDLEIIDLRHADVLASDTVSFTGETPPQLEPTKEMVDQAASALSKLLSESIARHKQVADLVKIAPLFFTGTGQHPFARGAEMVGEEFHDILHRNASANTNLHLIRFPRAYQATEEAEMVMDGLVEGDTDEWVSIADLYLWGTYSITNWRGANRLESRLTMTLHCWDGASEPLKFEESVDLENRTVPADQTAVVLNQMVLRAIAHAGKRQTLEDPVAMRRQISDSVTKAYLALNGPGGRGLDLQNPENFNKAVQMLETACFFDPENADAHVLRISCRWGWRMSFNVKNEFWSKWRGSQAWGDYAKRFGLAPVSVELPFPYNSRGIADIYLDSLREVIDLCPQNFDWGEDEPYGPMKEAQRHGFPTEISNEDAARWKAELQYEYWGRLNTVVDFIAAGGWNPDDRRLSFLLSRVVAGLLEAQVPPHDRLTALEKIWPQCADYARSRGRQWILGGGTLAQQKESMLEALCSQAGRANKAKEMLHLLDPVTETREDIVAESHLSSQPDLPPRSRNSQRVEVPTWLRDFRPYPALFRLSPPDLAPTEVHPKVQEFTFPAQFEVKEVNQLDVYQEKVLILATDERSAPSTDLKPDVSAEVLTSRGRMWSLEPGSGQPILFEEQLLPFSIHSFFLTGDRLWLAGTSTGCLDLETHKWSAFGLSQGLTIRQTDVLAYAAGYLFAAGDTFQINQLGSETMRWENLKLPEARLSHGTGNPYLMAGCSEWLSYVAGSTLLFKPTTKEWTSVPVQNVQCVAADDSGFWFGGDSGLHFYRPEVMELRSWSSPVAIQGMVNFSMNRYHGPGSILTDQELERLNDQVMAGLESIRKAREKLHAENGRGGEFPDPLRLDWRIPDDVTALAHDGEYLWLGVGRYSGSLLLLHKPTVSLVASWKLGDRITSIGVAESDIWVGASYGDRLLCRIPKDAFLSLPRSRWANLAVSPAERERIVQEMSRRDQAMLAFYSAEDAKIPGLLGNINPLKASLDELFILAFSFDTLGLDRPEHARVWFEHIIARDPESPWAAFARKCLAENESTHNRIARERFWLSKYDADNDGSLDKREIRAMKQDPVYQKEVKMRHDAELDEQIRGVIERMDRDADGKLNRGELDYLANQVRLFAEAPARMLEGRRVVVAPFLTKKFPTYDNIMKNYDVNHDELLEASELKTLALDIQKKR